MKFLQKSRGDGTGPLPHKGVGDRDGCRLPPSGTPRLLLLPVGDFLKIRKCAIFDQVWIFVGGKPLSRSRLYLAVFGGQGSPTLRIFKIHNRLCRLGVIRGSTPPSEILTKFSKNCRGVTPARRTNIFGGFCREPVPLQMLSDRSLPAPRVCPPRAPKIVEKRENCDFFTFDFRIFWGANPKADFDAGPPITPAGQSSVE